VYGSPGKYVCHSSGVIARDDDAHSCASNVAGVAPYMSVKKRDPLKSSVTDAICPLAGIATDICDCGCDCPAGTMRPTPTGWRNRPSSSPVSTT